MTTPVIFRKWKKKADQWESVIAVFPTIPAVGGDDWLCTAYEHVGQHGACDYYLAILPNTVPATPEEYKDLLKELKQIGYDDLVVYRRNQYRFYAERRKALREMDEAAKRMGEKVDENTN